MGYQILGKVKTVVLPITKHLSASDFCTLEEYKNDTGIDLTELIYLDTDANVFRIKKAYINSCFYVNYEEDDTMPLVPVVDFTTQSYISGSQNAYLCFVDADGYGIALQVYHTEDFTLENVFVWLVSGM